MARGITQDQVNRAADAILGAGENPTVEKVRVELGTGSPNTITRMLDSWRGQLGERLRQLSALPQVPESVGQVMIELWRLATEQAERTLEGRFATDRAALEADRTQLALERENWEVRLEVAETNAAQAQTARDLAEHVCATLDGQLQDSHALRADLLQQRDRLQEQYDQQSEQFQALRTQLDELHSALQAEHERQEAHIRTVEDRSHREVDRAREESKGLKQQLERIQQDQQQLLVDTERQRDSLHMELRKAEQEAAKQAGRATAMEIALAQAHAQTTKAAKGKRSPAKAVSPKPKRTAQQHIRQSKNKGKDL